MHGTYRAYNRWTMEWPDWNSLQIAKPEVLPWVGVALLLGVASLVLPWRHSRRTVAVAGLLRALVIGVLVFAIAGFVTVGETEQRYEPAGTWRLVLDGAQPPKGDAQDFSESPNAFVNRLRNALAGETPPAQTEVWGTRREDTLAARDAVQALGVPCTPHFPVEEQPASRPVLTGIDAPRIAATSGKVSRIRKPTWKARTTWLGKFMRWAETPIW